MVILARIKVGATQAETRLGKVKTSPQVQCRLGDDRELLIHAALLQRLGFDTPKIRRLLEGCQLMATDRLFDLKDDS